MLTPKLLGIMLIVLGIIGYLLSRALDSKLILFYSCMSGLFGIAACVRILANPETLKAKNFLLLGLDSDIGQEVASLLCSVNANVFVILEDANSKICKELRNKFPDNIIPFQSDLSSKDYASLVLEVEERLQNKTLKAVIFASDDLVKGDLELLPSSRITQVLEKNVSKVVETTKAFLPLIRESRGRFIFLGHAMGRFALPSFSFYSLTKHALEGFADGLRHEMRRFDVKIVTVERCCHQNLVKDEPLHESIWAEATTDAKETYGDSYIRQVAMTQDKTAQSSASVARVLVEALAADNPKDRYFVCTENRRWCISKVETLVSQFVPATLMELWVDLRHTSRLPRCLNLPPPAVK